MVSLYSGLGGAEISCKLLGQALATNKVTPPPASEQPPIPEFLLACDHNGECQKILHSHEDTCLSLSKTHLLLQEYLFVYCPTH